MGFLDGLIKANPIGTALGIGKSLIGLSQMGKANDINPQYDDSYLKKNIGMFQNLYNGRMPGATNLEQNIGNAQQNTISNAQRGATDASQALGIASASQGQANQSYNDLQTKEAQNKYAMADHLSNAYQLMNQQMMQKYQMDSQAKAATRNSAFQNIFGGVNDLASMQESNNQKDAMNKMWGNLLGGKGTTQQALPPLTTDGGKTTQQALPPLTSGSNNQMPQQQLQSLLGGTDLSSLSQDQINQLLGFIRR
jgi:hypothetical protein